jgi:ABC-2 type transport system ATP-binding protein
MKYAIETFDLTKRYGDFTAVDALDLKVEDKSIFGFLGPNGAGKTTTIKMLTCLIPPTSGTAHVAGYDELLKIQTKFAKNRDGSATCKPIC